MIVSSTAVISRHEFMAMLAEFINGRVGGRALVHLISIDIPALVLDTEVVGISVSSNTERRWPDTDDDEAAMPKIAINGEEVGETIFDRHYRRPPEF